MTFSNPRRHERPSIGLGLKATLAADPKAGRYSLIQNCKMRFDDALTLHMLGVERFAQTPPHVQEVRSRSIVEVVIVRNLG